VNAIVRPIAVVLTFPITIVTLGLFLLVINAAMLALVAALLPGLHVAGFRAALLGALIVSIIGWIGSFFVGSRARVEFYSHRKL
jgi:putative membrane protein